MNNKLARVKEILWVIALFGLVAIILRLFLGLGATTALSDEMPWGLWKILNMIAGVALATGGFMMACIVYIFHLKKYKPVLRLAILTAFLGYGSSCTALLFDIGLPHRCWHPMLFWNPHSFLFEVFWCVLLYFTVATFETMPVIIEKFNMDWLVNLFHKITVPLVVVGITLSSMHHTSLGSLFLNAPNRLHPLWWSMWLPVHFFFSAIGAGIMTIVFLYLIICYFYQKEEDVPMLEGLVKAGAGILAFAAILKAIDFAMNNTWQYLFAGTWESYLFTIEVTLSFILPIALVAMPSVRQTISGLFAISISAMLGLTLNRLDVGIFGFMRNAQVPYTPTLTELSLSFGIISAAGLMFFFMVERFHIIDGLGDKVTEETAEREKLSDRITRAWGHDVLNPITRISFIAVLVIPLAVLVFSSNALKGFTLEENPVHAPTALDPQRDILKINGDDDEHFVFFPHAKHKARNENDCQICHHLNLPNDPASPCYHCHRDMFLETSIFDHGYHIAEYGGNAGCIDCHDLQKPKSPQNAADCFACHSIREEYNMNMLKPEQGRFNYMADAYYDAMHNQCISCHTKEAEKQNKPEMTKCLFCHEGVPEDWPGSE